MAGLSSAKFWASAAERAVKTFAQALIAAFGAAGIGLMNAPWTASLSLAGMATVLSLLSSIVSAPVGPDGSPSLVGEPPKVDDGPGNGGPVFPYNPE